ncbi:MAG: GUN4 domain-containing protein [Limnospira sp.]
MRQCLNPDCLRSNPDNSQYCQKCGGKLLLRERYCAQSILGQGGFGRTFLAIDEDKPSKPLCVIKQFLPQAQGTDNIEKASQLFYQEAECLEDLGKHPQIPELFAYFISDNRQYLVQEFIPGETLESELDRHGVFSERQIRELLSDLLKILQFVHAKNVIHRDIKPDNIIRRSADQKLVLVDFGVAKVMRSHRTKFGTLIGTPGYCAPEQAMGQPQLNSDLYSLGVTCLHLLTRAIPSDFPDSEEGWIWQNFLQGNSVDRELEKILDRLVERDFGKRYQSATEVLDDLEPVTPRRYQRLENLLAIAKWREADEETTRLMLQVAGRKNEGWLRVKDIENFPCQDLRVIDRLWVKYSGGRFGFSVQKQIYDRLGGTKEYNAKIWNDFGKKVGWKKGKQWLHYNNMTFEKKAPEGHLPSGRVPGVFGWMAIALCEWGGEWGWWWRICTSLASRLAECN